ncbi:3-phosphoshikimate 1-carboxyvinyltransferase [Amphibacillus marinus]|uniref:3-phosphoshikimate 1-carboxyvinyltransferase n=1 Tax=Amphibacillus marinus TaxID=872970 RepID=A0A1H8GH37_9BACI|nr:3-phosphoshikimate 1-carboxyvinyltransferase [Amphibacillus marinus]SEN43090.1 3-phosphoshikimate 1-carboxyvinyltransferase [Amphibacillus marinus]
MSTKQLQPVNKALQGRLAVPGDKSISHRAVILGSLASGETIISNFLNGEDCLTTIAAFQAMGVQIEYEGDHVKIVSHGFKRLKEPKVPIDLGNSGTTARLLLGVLAALPFHTTLFGDQSLTKRPMDRIRDPLRQMGASIDGRENGKYLPLAVRGGRVKGITFKPSVKSAQIKSGVLLAGLFAEGETTVVESTKTRDHTENMLTAFGGSISIAGNVVKVKGGQALHGTSIQVPGDISSAAFFIVAGLLVPGSEVTINNVGLNQTRTGLLDVLELMKVDLQVTETNQIGGESIGTVTVRHSKPEAVVIGGDVIPRMIDEIPIVALLASQANGTTIIKDAEELRYKETDRIESVVQTLSALGVDITATADGMIIKGNAKLTGAELDSYGDHRIGMMIAIAALISDAPVTLKDAEAINISYPNFFDDLEQLS